MLAAAAAACVRVCVFVGDFVPCRRPPSRRNYKSYISAYLAKACRSCRGNSSNVASANVCVLGNAPQKVSVYVAKPKAEAHHMRFTVCSLVECIYWRDIVFAYVVQIIDTQCLSVHPAGSFFFKFCIL